MGNGQLLEVGETQFFRDMAPNRLNTPQWNATHQRVNGQYKSDLISFFFLKKKKIKKEDTK